MIWKITLSPESLRFLTKLPADVQTRIDKKLRWLASLQDPQAITKPLQDSLAGFHRLRVGNIRVILEYQLLEVIMHVSRIAFRSNVYN